MLYLDTESDARLAEDLGDYWNGRAQSYSNGVVGELADERKLLWSAALEKATRGIVLDAAMAGRKPLACDLGCGPGFFSILLSELGFSVEAVDASPSMVGHAQDNIAQAVPVGDVTFHVCDLLSLPFPDDTFDLCVSRNVTWLMRDPQGAYAEWLRVLKPGGKLIAYDANWYRYLVDPTVAARRAADQSENVLEGWDEEAQATSDEEKRCEELARSLPLTPVLRPAWDLQALEALGVSQCSADEDAWQHVWTENEQLYYGSTPTFMVEAVK